jgi:hypothetical protein
MVDRSARNKAVELLRAMLAEGITNYRLEDEWPGKSCDFVIRAVAEQLWFYYDDYPEKILTRTSLGPEVSQLVERSVAFLTSDLEYGWPEYSFATENRSLLERLFGLGKQRSSEEWERFKAAGETEAWPFLQISEWEEMRRQAVS